MVEDAPSEKEALEKFIAFAGKGVLVAHNADFDTSFIKIACARQGLTYDIRYTDTLKLARAALPHLKNFKLDTVAKEFKLGDFNHHRAIDDAGNVVQNIHFPRKCFLQGTPAREIRRL